MLDADHIHSLPQLAPPVLTLYLDLNPANPRNQGHPPGYLIWFKSRAKVIGSRAAEGEQKLFREQLKRVEDFLRNRPLHERGLVIFAGPKAWEVLPLRVQVEDELHWGSPSLVQLLWLLDEHQPCGVMLVDRSGARFLRLWLGEFEEQERERLALDLSEWRKQHLAAPSRPGTHKMRGSERDVFEQSFQARYARFYRETAERMRQWAAREKLDPVFVVGPDAAAEAVWAELPKTFRERGGLVKGDLSHLSVAELQQRLELEVSRWKREAELKLVERMLNSRNATRAVLGMDETLAQLQRGGARELVVVRGLGGKLRQCVKCGWADRSADRVCAACGGERRVVALRAVLPELARRYGVPVEVVAGEAGRKLRETGAIGAFLR